MRFRDPSSDNLPTGIFTLPFIHHCLYSSGSRTSKRNTLFCCLLLFAVKEEEDPNNLLSSCGEISLSALDSLNCHLHDEIPPSKYLAFNPICLIISDICFGYSSLSPTSTISTSFGKRGIMFFFDSSLHTAQAEPGICFCSNCLESRISNNINGS